MRIFFYSFFLVAKKRCADSNTLFLFFFFLPRRYGIIPYSLKAAQGDKDMRDERRGWKQPGCGWRKQRVDRADRLRGVGF